MRKLLIEKKALNLLEIESLIYNYKTKHRIGLTKKELTKILLKLEISPNVFSLNFGINTCALIDGEYVIYHGDVLKTIKKVKSF